MTPLKFIRRRLLRNRAFPESWLKLLNEKVPYYNFLPTPLKDELRMHLPVFLDEKIFEGCGGLVMTDEIKIIIASYATILVLEDPSPAYYPSLQAILVYPGDYIAPVHEESESGIITEGVESRSGESWNLGSIVLSWRDIQRDIRHPLDGRNLVFHEFAHQLDDRYGVTAGMDDYGNLSSPNEWNEIFAKAYRSLRRSAKKGTPSLLDTYGAANPAEFFSVATENFFERGRRLKIEHPDLYEMLRRFYNLDPAAFLPLS